MKAQDSLFDAELQKRKNFKVKFLSFASLLVSVIIIVSYRDYKNSLRFMTIPGFYDDDIYLEISGDTNYTIYYTLDGSEPSKEAILYEKPIYISDVSSEKNTFADFTNVSTGFLTELIEKYSYNVPQYMAPDYEVDKCQIIRAAAFDEQGNRISDIQGSFFVDFEDKAGYEDMKIVSVITSPDNLFDYDRGIYITGRAFDEYLQACQGKESSVGPYWWWWTANYSARGFDSEREGHIEIYDEKRQLLLSENCGIRIQGGGSRGLLPKSLGIYARQEYSGSEEFDCELFGKGMKPHKFVLFSGGDDRVFKIKDYMANSLEKGLHFSTMDFQPCVVFLDGEYWGAYYLTENYNSDYVEDHYNVTEDNVIIIKAGGVAEGEEADAGLYQDMRSFISENDMTVEENYLEAESLIDISSYIDYYAAQIYIGRYNDWPGGNEGLWRSRNIKSGSEYEDGRWRWMLYDVNSGGMSLDQLEVDTLATVIGKDGVFSSLIQNDSFRKLFAERLLYIADHVYSEENYDTFIDNYLKTMTEPLCVSNRRFYGKERREEIISNAEDLRAFFEQRKSFIEDSVCNNLGEEYLQ